MKCLQAVEFVRLLSLLLLSYLRGMLKGASAVWEARFTEIIRLDTDHHVQC